MEYRTYGIVVHSLRRGLLTLNDIARETGIHPDLVADLVELGLLEPERESPELLFTEDAVKTACRAVRLHTQLGINWVGVGLVMHLLDRIDELEEEIRKLRGG
ncbi:MAG: chaperone modulator CbpM [Chitinophagales bacterium]